MPKKTFYNLKDEKRKKIERALIKEFTNESFEKASISNIIEMAGIPRGSFYQYFEDKEDAIYYVIEKFMTGEKKKIYSSLISNKGNIFETAIDVYDYMINIMTENAGLFKNVLQEIRKNDMNLFGEEAEESKTTILRIVNKETLNLKTEEELPYFLKILNAITRNSVMDVIKGSLSIEEARNKLIKELEILKRGMEKH